MQVACVGSREGVKVHGDSMIGNYFNHMWALLNDFYTVCGEQKLCAIVEAITVGTSTGGALSFFFLLFPSKMEGVQEDFHYFWVVDLV